MQWGYTRIDGSGTTITFPISFTLDSAIHVQFTRQSSADLQYSIGWWTETDPSYIIAKTNRTDGEDMAYSWFAIGY